MDTKDTNNSASIDQENQKTIDLPGVILPDPVLLEKKLTKRILPPVKLNHELPPPKISPPPIYSKIPPITKDQIIKKNLFSMSRDMFKEKLQLVGQVDKSLNAETLSSNSNHNSRSNSRINQSTSEPIVNTTPTDKRQLILKHFYWITLLVLLTILVITTIVIAVKLNQSQIEYKLIQTGNLN